MPDLQVLSTLHESQANVVLHARDSQGREIAVKIARSGNADALRREMEVSRRLQPAGFRSALQLTEHEGLPALHLQYLPGEPLHHLIRHGPLTPGEFLNLAVPLTQRVEAMHQLEVVHRDIKPQNVLRDADSGAVHLIDYSLSTLTARRANRHAEFNVLQGSLPYMSPEQTGRVNRAVDHRSDLYSLGVLFYELLTGQLPFQAQDAMGWVYAHIAHAPPSPADVRAELAGPLSAIVLKLLDKNPEGRYQSAAGLLADLQACASLDDRTLPAGTFELARHDRDERFRLPGRLYGRKSAVEELFAHLEQALAGRTTCVLVAGPSGIGKTELIHELQRPAARAGGRFLSGKFSQLHRNFPFHALVQAVQELVRQVLGEGPASRDTWSAHLRDALQDNLGIIHQLIPEVAWITGPAAPPPDMPLAEHQRLLERTFQQFVLALARPEAPLVLFMDDLQWADASTLTFLRALAAHPAERPLLLVGAYRDRPDGPAPTAPGVAPHVHTIRLGPLGVDDINVLLSDTLRQVPERTEGLARQLHRRTRGNPFFVQQFLQAMHDEGAITPDGRGGFHWDDDRVLSMNAAENVVDLLTQGMSRLPAITRTVLMQAACLGNTFELAPLAALRDEGQHITLDHLRPALHEGYVDGADRTFRFLHDRVMEAALGLGTPHERSAVHLAAGRVMRASLTREAPAEALFDVAGHLNRAEPLMTDPAERLATATLNLNASRAARHATAYDVAVQYAQAALKFMPADAWEAHHDLNFKLHLNAAMMHFLTHDGPTAERHLKELHARARTRTERLRIYESQVVLLNCENRFDESIAIAREALLEYGVDLSDDRLDDMMTHEVGRVRRNLDRVGTGNLANLPPMQDPDVLAVYTLLLGITMPSYFVHPALSDCTSVMRVNLLLEHGSHPSAPVAYATFCRVLSYNLGEYDAARRLAHVAMDIAERSGHPMLRTRAIIQVAAVVLHWTQPVARTLDLLDRTARLAANIGDYQLATLAAYASPAMTFQSGRPFAEVTRTVDEYDAFLRSSGSEFALNMTVLRQTMACLQGHTSGPLDLGSVSFADSPGPQWPANTRQLHTSIKLLLSVLFEEHEVARIHLRQSAEMRASGLGSGSYLYAEDTFLSLLALLRDPDGLSAHASDILAGERQLGIWAQHAPENFRHMHLLVQAEIHRAR